MSITAASIAALERLDAVDGPMPVHSIFPSGVNLRCGDYLVHAGTRPLGGACSLAVTERDVELLGRQPAWEWAFNMLMALDGLAVIDMGEAARCYPTSPPESIAVSADTPGQLERARARTGAESWFDSGLGRSEGLPRLGEAIRALVEGRADAEERLRGVVGLGAGLTPSADDALVGALCLLSAADGMSLAGLREDRNLAGLSEDMTGWLRAEGAGSTTDVSLSYLRLAFDGEFSGPVNRVVGSLTERSLPAEVDESIRALAAVGATSGMDTALGIQLACEFLTRPTPDPDLS